MADRYLLFIHATRAVLWTYVFVQRPAVNVQLPWPMLSLCGRGPAAVRVYVETHQALWRDEQRGRPPRVILQVMDRATAKAGDNYYGD